MDISTQTAHAPFKLAPLPYPENALEPVISARTLSFHHGKHHKTYVETLNKLVAGDPLGALPLDEIVRRTAGKKEKTKVFNNAAQVFNHELYWSSLSPSGGGAPQGEIKTRIASDLGGAEKFRTDFATAAIDVFGTGWAWLVWKRKEGKLAIEPTVDADTPIARGDVPLLTIDVWEHAYYLDHQNDRKAHVEAVIDKLLNWDWAAKQLARAKG